MRFIMSYIKWRTRHARVNRKDTERQKSLIQNYENCSSNWMRHSFDKEARSLALYRNVNVWRRRPRPVNRVVLPGRSDDRLLAQFIMFRLSSHLAREIEWRFSFGDTGRPGGNNSGAVSLSLFPRVSLVLLALSARRIIVLAATTRSPPSRSSFLSFAPTRQRAAFFRRVTQSVRRTPREYVTVCTRNISRDVMRMREHKGAY